MNFDDVINKVLDHEGFYSNDQDDPGGETKYGISKRAYPNVDIKNLTLEEAKKIYYRDYWLKSFADKLPEGVRYIHFDTAVNMGLNRAAKLLQQSIGNIAVDGDIGPITLAGASNTSVAKYAICRLAYYMQIIGRRHSSAKYAKGWANRVLDIVNE